MEMRKKIDKHRAENHAVRLNVINDQTIIEWSIPKIKNNSKKNENCLFSYNQWKSKKKEYNFPLIQW